MEPAWSVGQMELQVGVDLAEWTWLSRARSEWSRVGIEQGEWSQVSGAG